MLTIRLFIHSFSCQKGLSKCAFPHAFNSAQELPVPVPNSFSSKMVITRASFSQSLFKNCKSAVSSSIQCRQASQTAEQQEETEEFRVLQLIPKRGMQNTRRKQRQMPVPPPRTEKMPIDQHWPSVWPGPRTFHPASVPLPLRQGYPHNKKPTPGKFANAELMKIPNFLHLTPPAIKQQCEALKKFCTEWPKGLETPEQQEAHFPVEVITNTYCHSSPSIRDPLARIVTLKVSLKTLPLDAHAKDKLLRLVGERYDPNTDVITLVADRCPVKKQNYDYAYYLLTALFHESWKIEPWEKEKGLADMELFIWEGSASEENLGNFLQYREKLSGDDKAGEEDKIKLKDAITSLFNDGEDVYTVNKYKEAVKKLVSIKS